MLRRSPSSNALQSRISQVTGASPSRTLTPRSKLALTAGFVIAAAAILIVGPQSGAVFAESDDSGAFWRAEQSRKKAERPRAVAAPPAHAQQRSAWQASPPQRNPQMRAQPATPPRHMTAYAPIQPPPRPRAEPFWFFAQPGGPPAMLGQAHRADMQQPRRSTIRQQQTASQARNFSQRPRQATSRMVCVRLCDGYFFPAPSGMGASDAACAAACPDAPARLYSMRTDRIIDAVAVRDGARYANLPVALRYTRTIDRTCSCGAPDPRAMIMADASLRTGDRFMSENGFLIYRRAESGRISPRDFTTLARTRNLPHAERNLLMAMERVSLPRPSERLAAASNNSPTHVALGPPPRPLSLR